jgi:ferredoxin-NADP reductase
VSAPGALRWRTATIAAIEPRTPTIRSFFFALPEPVRFVAGQHMDVRLTAEDGYEAQRSYSIASAPDAGGPIELAIERLADGEVSPFFHDVARPGDEIELRGPIGGHFVWSVDDGGPVLLVGGGSGVVPLACMVRHHALRGSAIPLALATSARTAADLLYSDEMRAALGPRYIATVTREAAAPGRRHGRIDAAFLRDALQTLGAAPRHVFVCGSNAFVEHVTQRLDELAVLPALIRTERYGG